MSEFRKLLSNNFHALINSEGLRGRFLRGGVCLGGGSFVEQVIRFARNMLLTRLLVPEAFGAMAIVQSVTTLIQMTVDVGAREALIQNPKGAEDSHVTAAWWMTTFRSSLIYLVIFVFAPEIARFYGNVDLTSLARIVSLSIVFDGLISPRAYVAIKTMKFSKWASVNNGGGILGVITTIILGFYMRDVWALAIGFCSENLARCVLSYVICPYRPHLPNFHAIRDLLKFSKGLAGIILLNMIFMRADVFVLGKLYTAAALGLYSMAVYLVQTPGTFLINVMNQTLLPALSGMQNDNARINRILVQMTSMTVWLGLPIVLFVTLCGRALLTLAYGQRYGTLSLALGLACCGVFFNVLNNQITQIFYAKGLPQLHRRAVAVMAFCVALFIYPSAKIFGIWGGQLACLLAMLAGYGLQIERVRKVTGLKLSEYWNAFPVPVSVSVAVAVLWVLISTYSDFAREPLSNIAFGIVGCLLVYSLVLALRLLMSKNTAEA